MSNVTIETYRGIEIWFNTNNESFQCDIDDERSVKKSYPAIKKFIDEFKKENDSFKSFNVEPNPIRTHGGKFGKIIGIRKDKKFVIELPDGKQEQIPDYRLDNFILPVNENEPIKEEIAKAQERISELYEIINDLESGLKIVTLKDVKPQYV